VLDWLGCRRSLRSRLLTAGHFPLSSGTSAALRALLRRPDELEEAC